MRLLLVLSAHETGTIRLLDAFNGRDEVDSIDLFLFDRGLRPGQIRQRWHKVRRITGEEDLVGLQKKMRPDEARHIVAAAEAGAGFPPPAALAKADRHIGSSGVIGVFYRSRPRIREGLFMRMLAARIRLFQDLINEDTRGVYVSDVRLLSSMTAYLTARSRGVPFFRAAPGRVMDRFILTSTIDEDSKPLREALPFHAPTTASREAAAAIAESARSGRPLYAIPGEEGAEIRPGVVRPRRWSSFVLKMMRRPRLFFRDPHYYITPPAVMLLGRIQSRWRAWYLKALFRWTPPASDEPFLLFPLQALPEISLQVWAPDLGEPEALIDALRRRLPPGHVLAVREHPVMLGMRPMRFYRHLRRGAGIRLVSTRVPMHDLLEQAAGVITVTGTTGLEAALMGKPVITLGKPFYSNIEGVQQRSLVLGPGLVKEPIMDLADVDPDLARNTEAFVAKMLDLGIATGQDGYIDRIVDQIIDASKGDAHA